MNDEQFFAQYPYPDQAGLKSLYKFLAFDGENPSRAEDILVHGLLYFPLPSQLNDPWECRPTVRLKRDAISKRKLMARMSALAPADKTEKYEHKKYFRRSFKNDPNATEKALISSVRRIMSTARICSFAGQKSNSLLWSHYANSHTGFCLEFDTKFSPFCFAQRVKYQSDYPSVDYPFDSDWSPGLPSLTKSTDWEYENEFRNVVYKTASSEGLDLSNGYAEIPKEALIEVYIGALMPEEQRSQLLGIIRSGPFEPKISIATQSKSSYKLEFLRK